MDGPAASLRLKDASGQVLSEVPLPNEVQSGTDRSAGYDIGVGQVVSWVLPENYSGMLWIEVSSTVQAPYQLGIQIVNNRQILNSASLTRQTTGGQVDLVPLEIIEQGGKPDFNLPGMSQSVIGTF